MKEMRLYTIDVYPDNQGIHYIHTETCEKAPPIIERHIFFGAAWVEEVIESALSRYPDKNMWLCEHCCTHWEEDYLLLKYPYGSRNK